VFLSQISPILSSLFHRSQLHIDMPKHCCASDCTFHDIFIWVFVSDIRYQGLQCCC